MVSSRLKPCATNDDVKEAANIHKARTIVIIVPKILSLHHMFKETSNRIYLGDCNVTFRKSLLNYIELLTKSNLVLCIESLCCYIALHFLYAPRFYSQTPH